MTARAWRIEVVSLAMTSHAWQHHPLHGSHLTGTACGLLHRRGDASERMYTKPWLTEQPAVAGCVASDALAGLCGESGVCIGFQMHGRALQGWLPPPILKEPSQTQ